MHLVLLPEVLWVDPLVQLLVDLLEVLLEALLMVLSMLLVDLLNRSVLRLDSSVVLKEEGHAQLHLEVLLGDREEGVHVGVLTEEGGLTFNKSITQGHTS